MSRIAPILLVLFTLCVGIHAQGPPGQAPFVNSTLTSNLIIPSTLSGGHGHYRGCAWADFDNDGDQDLFAVTNSYGPVQLWLNNGLGVFTSQIVLPTSTTIQQHHGCVAADFDNDGDSDVFVCVGNFQANLLFVNQGNGTFTEEAATRGLLDLKDTQSATWGDYDRDGFLDLYVGSMFGPVNGYSHNNLYRNNGDGTFSDVTNAAGVLNSGLALAQVFFDFDKDGWQDIVYGHDRGVLSMPPTGILRNNGDGTFSEVGPSINCAAPIDCMGVCAGDFDNDDDWDFYMTNSAPGDVLFQWDAAAGAFDLPAGNYQQVAANMGLAPPANYWSAWACHFMDYDADGRLELFVMNDAFSNKVFRGMAGAPFVDVTSTLQMDVIGPPGYSACPVDYDNDGDLDYYQAGWYTAAQMLENPGYGNNWLMIKTQGTLSNRDGIGALIIARSSSGSQMRAVTSGEGFLSDGDKRAHFGLGTDPVVDELEIRWPSGTVQYLSNIAVNQHITVVEPSFAVSGPLSPGSSALVTLTLPDDVGLFHVSPLTLNIAPDTPLPGGRYLRTWIGDPLIPLSTTPGNPTQIGYSGLIIPGGANSLITIPNVPTLSGFHFWKFAVTIDHNYPGSVKSIIGPQRIDIN